MWCVGRARKKFAAPRPRVVCVLALERTVAWFMLLFLVGLRSGKVRLLCWECKKGFSVYDFHGCLSTVHVRWWRWSISGGEHGDEKKLGHGKKRERERERAEKTEKRRQLRCPW